ncbi:MAG: ABC transporter substrate-binding protein [Defluviitaleaceae bacterium]|nr:ABC transporter substrate-binding protein [Defluviitaleaceae bacterium]
MKRKGLLALALASIMILAACTQPPTQPPAQPPEQPQQQIVQPPADATPPTVEETGLQPGIIVVTRDEPPVVAPGRHNAVAGGYMNSMTHNALFRIHSETLQPVEDLVASWVAISDTVFEFTLHEGVEFHNGEILTAHDVIASFEYVRNYPDARASRESIVYFEAIDDLTVRIDTVEPNALFFLDLTHSSNHIMPASLIAQGHDFNDLPVGTGPFVFEEWRTGDSLHFTNFENHFNRDRAARVEYATWRIIPEGSSRTIALETGEGHFSIYVALPDVARLEAHPDITVATFPGVGHNKLLMNNDLPQFSDPQVRRAMGMAIDKEAVAIVGFEGFAFPVWAQVPMVFPGATDEGTYSFDPEGAAALLAELGVDPGTLGFSIIASNEERRRAGEVFQANLAEIGIPVTIEMNDLATTLSRTTDGDYETGFGGFNSASFLGYARGVLHINNIDGSNRSRIRNQELSDLIDQALATIDSQARLPIYEQISRVANEHTGHIPTHMTMNVRAFNANLNVPELSSAGGLNINMMSWNN